MSGFCTAALRTWGLVAVLQCASVSAQAPPVGPAPERIRRTAMLVNELVPVWATAPEARARLEAHGLYCTWGGSPLLENIGARFLVCSPSCIESIRDGWWVYLAEVVGKGVQHIEATHAGTSLIKPFLPEGCPKGGQDAISR